MATLTEAERADALRDLPGWSLVDGRDAMQRTYRLGNFIEAFSFMTACALEAEKADHHPEWSNVYRTVDVLLTTHDAGGLTGKDLALARAFDRAFNKVSGAASGRAG